MYKNKWKFTHSIQWELNQQALVEASKTDGIFPLITNTVLDIGCTKGAMEAGGSLMEHNRFFNKFGGDIQKIFSRRAKCKLKALFI